MFERVSNGRTVVLNTSDFKGYPAPKEEQTQDCLNVAEEPAACKVELTQLGERRGAVCGLRYSS